MAHQKLNHGLSDNTVTALRRVFARYPLVDDVILYGSRAKGNYTTSSDIDIAISAPAMSKTEFAKLWNALEELPLIYKLDCLHLDTLQNKNLKENIVKQGITIK